MCLILSCNKDDEGAELFKASYIGNELNIHAGLYLHRDSAGEILSSFFFYRDGVMIDPGAIDQEKIDRSRDAGGWEDAATFKDNKSRWGIFEISNDEIKIEQWVVFQNDPLKTIVSRGVILSDTSFTIREVVNNRTNEVFEIDWLYELESFAPKPDSTNTFIQ